MTYDMTLGKVIGPIDFRTWRSMRDTRESITFCKVQVMTNPVYQKEIDQETELYGQLMDEALGRAA